MINQESIRVVGASRLDAEFGRPLYSSYSFAQIPQAVRYLLTGAGDLGLPPDTIGDVRRYDRVILLVIDALGWRFIEQYADDYPFLRRMVADGVVSKLSSQFPSTTAAHMTTIHTGLTVGASGVFEWFYYEPLLDRIIAPLLFSFAGDKERNTLRAAEIAPRELYPTTTLYQDLAPHGIRSFVFQQQDYAFSPFSKAVTAGAQLVSYATLAEALVNFTQRVLAEKGRAYYMLYYGSIDSTCHHYGPESPQLAAEIDLFLTAMERIFHKALAGKLKNTLFLMTADHGQIAIDPATTIFLNQSLPEIAPYLRTNRAGQPLVPAGSSRDMFLYINEEHLDEAQAYLQAQLAGRAEVRRVADLIDEGLFGPGAPSQAFLDRVGNLVILPRGNESVWWYEAKRFEQKFRGSHGGLTREELETVLLALPYE